jgi:hypothetical protein
MVVDEVQLLRLMVAAGKRLRELRASGKTDAPELAELSRLLREVNVAVARSRRVGDVLEMFEEVLALEKAGVDPADVQPKLARARELADEVALELGVSDGDTTPTPAAVADDGEGEPAARPRVIH